MPDPSPYRRFRFGTFEADTVSGELRRQGIRIKLNVQPFQLLMLLLDRPGELMTRDEIARCLWPEGTFVDFEHGVNSAVNRIREALGDSAANPRFVETLSRRGYRFIAPVERICLDQQQSESLPETASQVSALDTLDPEPDSGRQLLGPILATQEELPQASHRLVQTLYVLLQLMYVSFYVGALANLAEIEDLLSVLPRASLILNALIVTAGILIPVRAFSLSAVLLHAPGTRRNLLTLWPFVLPFDLLWALSPFLLLHHINSGLALACTALLIYSPFAQRSLVLMGAGDRQSEGSTTTN